MGTRMEDMDASADTAHRLLVDAARRLLRRAAGGDVDAFATFYDLTSATVHRLAMLLTRDVEAAACLTTLTYEQAWAEASSFDQPHGSPLVWLLAMTQAANRDVAPAA